MRDLQHSFFPVKALAAIIVLFCCSTVAGAQTDPDVELALELNKRIQGEKIRDFGAASLVIDKQVEESAGGGLTRYTTTGNTTYEHVAEFSSFADIHVAGELTIAKSDLSRIGGCVWNDSSFQRSFQVIWKMWEDSGGEPGSEILSVNDTFNVASKSIGCAETSISISQEGTFWTGIVYDVFLGDNVFLEIPLDTSGPGFNPTARGTNNNWDDAQFIFDGVEVQGMPFYVEGKDASDDGGGDDGGGDDGGGALSFGTTASVQGGRFDISMIYATSSGDSGSAKGAVWEDASSFWHFFGQANIEVFAKVLDGCGINNRFWVFLAGATDVGVTVTITDTQTGVIKTYSNPVGTTFVTVTDTLAFEC